MTLTVSIARWGLAVVLISSCGTPPEYIFSKSSPVTVIGQSCQADQYTVNYTRFVLGTPDDALQREKGTQYRIECGTVTTFCTLNQPLDACIAGIERPESSSSGSGYSPPG